MAISHKNNNKYKGNKKRHLNLRSKKKRIKLKPELKVKNNIFQKGGAFYEEYLVDGNNIFESFMKSSQIRKNKLEVMPSPTQEFYSKGDKTNEAYKENVKKGIENYIADPRAHVLTFICMHGKYFTDRLSQGTLEYFIVPSNVIICILTPPDTYNANYNIKHPYYFLQDNVFQTMKKYRSKLKEETFFYDRWYSAQVDLSDYFKFSNWFYPGQLCHNFKLSLSEREFQERKKENFDLFMEKGGNVGFGNWIIKYLYERFHKPGAGISLEGQEIIKSLNPSYKYFLLIESCNMTDTNKYEAVKKYGSHLYNMYHLNQWVVRAVEQELDTPVPTLEETKNFKYQGIRNQLQSLFRHSANDTLDKIAPFRLTDYIDRENTKTEYFAKDYKIEMYYEIIEKLSGSYSDVTEMQEYFKFLKNLSMVEMLHFTQLLAKKLGSIEKKNLLFMIKSVFGNNYFLKETNNKISQVFQVIRALNNVDHVKHIRNVEENRKALNMILNNFVIHALEIQYFLNVITEDEGVEKEKEPSLSSLRGVLDALNMRDADKYKYVIQQETVVGAAAELFKSGENHKLICTLLIKSCKNLPPGSIDLKTYRFDSLEIFNCQTNDFDDRRFQYDLEYFRTHSLDCLVQNSHFQASPRCSIFQYINYLYITKFPPKQTKLKIGHYFHNLNKLTVEVSSHIQQVAIENNKVESILVNSPTEVPISPIIHIRALNLQILQIKNVSLQNLILHNCGNLTTLSLELLELGTERTNQLFNFIPRLKKLHLKHCKFIGGNAVTNKLIIPPRLEDILIHNFDNGTIDFSETTLDGLKRASLLFVKMSVKEILDAKDKFSREKLDYLYIILDNMDKPESEQRQKFYELEDYLESIGSRVIQRTHTDSEYEHFFH